MARACPPPPVAIYYPTQPTEYTAPDPEVITRAWLEQILGSRHLEAIPCEEDHLTDDSYQPLYYLLVDAQGYTHDRPRNESVEAVHPDTVSIHTWCPSDGQRHAWVGLYGPAVLLPRSLVPHDTLPRWHQGPNVQPTP